MTLSGGKTRSTVLDESRMRESGNWAVLVAGYLDFDWQAVTFIKAVLNGSA
ncbi:MAG: hypothetical protein KGK44_01780 [Gammaproteobacteria bacterium]|nr:hypothetical protein [Gammaproteobacteria bacterium]